MACGYAEENCPVCGAEDGVTSGLDTRPEEKLDLVRAEISREYFLRAININFKTRPFGCLNGLQKRSDSDSDN
jgi:hypothetical protein